MVDCKALLRQVIGILQRDGVEAYAVGGTVRDLLLGREFHDLDFATPRDGIKVGRSVADTLGVPFYPLDPERHTGRVVVRDEDGRGVYVDFASYRGRTLEEDLADRDFTVNAMALPISAIDGPRVAPVDPFGGERDLRAGLLRAVCGDSFRNDPVRMLRAVRQAHEFGMEITDETRSMIARDAPLINATAAERIREELLRILSLPDSASVIRDMDGFSLLSRVLPELAALKGIGLSPPHVNDVYGHSIGVLGAVEYVTSDLPALFSHVTTRQEDVALLKKVEAHLREQTSPGCTRLQLLKLAALLHDTGKARVEGRERVDGYLKFPGHEDASVRLAGDVARRLRLGNKESAMVQRVIQHHSRMRELVKKRESVNAGDFYLYFRDAGGEGIELTLHSMADYQEIRASHGESMETDGFGREILAVALALFAYYYDPDTPLVTGPLLDGSDLLRDFNLRPGPIIGKVLDALALAQASGRVRDVEEARAFVAEYLQSP